LEGCRCEQTKQVKRRWAIGGKPDKCYKEVKDSQHRGGERGKKPEEDSLVTREGQKGKKDECPMRGVGNDGRKTLQRQDKRKIEEPGAGISEDSK